MAEGDKVNWVGIAIVGTALATVTGLIVKWVWDKYVPKHEA